MPADINDLAARVAWLEEGYMVMWVAVRDALSRANDRDELLLRRLEPIVAHLERLVA